MDPNQHREGADRYPRRSKWVLIGFLMVAAFFLWTEHRAHLLGILPYLLVLACPLMHLFHHRGHRHHGSSTSSEADNVRQEQGRVGDGP